MSTLLAKIDPFNQLMKNFDAFYSFPTGTKPPSDYVYKTDESGDKILGVEIQLALAGYSEKDIKVWREGSVVCVSGSNLENSNLSAKFTSKFEKAFSITKYYDLDEISVSFENGLLRICIPVAEKEKIKHHLFGTG